MDNVNEITKDETLDQNSKDGVQSKPFDLFNSKTSVPDETSESPKTFKGFKSLRDSEKLKIKDSIQDFLDQESKMLPTVASGVKYNLADEYASTKRNFLKSSMPVILWLAVAIVFVGIMVGTIFTIVNRQNRNIEVEVQSFDSLNLGNLLDLVSEAQSKINEESTRKTNLESMKKSLIAKAEAERSSGLSTINSLNLKDASEKRRMQNEIQATYDAAIKNANDLDVQIEKAEQNIKLYQQQLAQYDTTTVQQAKEHQAEMDSEKKLHQIEKQQMASEFEGKLSDLQKNLDEFQQTALEKQEEMVGFVKQQYDPTFSDDKAALSLVTKVSTSYSNYYSGSKTKVDENASEGFKSALEKQRQYYNEMSTIGSRFLRIPQKNAIPSFASALQKIANSAGNELANASVQEVNSLLGKNYELKDLNKVLEEDKSKMTVQIEGLEGEKQELISQNGVLSEEKIALEGIRQNLASKMETLEASNTELSNENSKLSSDNESLSIEKSELAQTVDSLTKEKESIESAWKTEKSRMEETWANEKSVLVAENSALAAEKQALEDMKSEYESLSSTNANLAAESEKIKKDYQNLVAEKEKLDSQAKSLVAEKESLAGEKKKLEDSNKALASQNSQYSQLLQAMCTRDGTKIHGLVSGSVNSRRIMVYVEKSAYATYASKVVPGVVVPVKVVRNGKTIAWGKLSIESGVAYMIKGGEEDQILIESMLNLEGLNDYSAIMVGDEIQISSPL